MMGEECDDRSLRGQDGCSGTCKIETPAWRQLPTTVAFDGPSQRELHAMVYDARRGKTVLFGGIGSGDLDDTWEWDGVRWRQSTDPFRPPARDDHAMAFDARRGRTVLFGGAIGGNAPFL